MLGKMVKAGSLQLALCRFLKMLADWVSNQSSYLLAVGEVCLFFCLLDA